MIGRQMNPNRFYIEGNNGGDYLVIEPLPDGRIHLEVGHCCVIGIDHIVPVEFITSVLSAAVIEHGSVKAVMESMRWDRDYIEQLVAQIEER